MTKTFEFENARKINEQGEIQLDCTVLEDGVPQTGFPLFLTNTSDFQLAQEAAETWVDSNPEEIADYNEPTLLEIKDALFNDLMNQLNDVVNILLNKYVVSDPLQWGEKEAQAISYLAIDPENRTPEDMPNVNKILLARDPNMSVADRVVFMNTEAPAIIVKAEAFRSVNAMAGAIRDELKEGLDNALSQEVVDTVHEAVLAMITQLKTVIENA